MPPKSETSTSADLQLRLEEIEDEMKDIFDDIERTKNLGCGARTDSSKTPMFKAHLSRLDHNFEKLLTLYKEAKRTARQLNEDDIHVFHNLRDAARTCYYEALSMDYNDDHSQPCSQNRSFDRSSSDVPPRIRLPVVPVPTFSGDVSQWKSFKDTFESLVHCNQDLPIVHKFHYLRSALKGSAYQTIAAIPISEIGYPQAWEALTKRYDNKRIQATNHLMKVFNFKPLPKQSLNSLEKFAEIFIESAIAFQNLELADPAGFILLTFGLRVLDSTTRERFETKHCARPEIPTFKDFQEFIQEQCIQLQTSHLTTQQSSGSNYPTKGSKPTKQVFMTTEPTPSSKPECFECHEMHRIYECPRFRSMTQQQRYERIKSLRRCINCLLSGHISARCPSPTCCRYCSRKHHSLLHFTSTNNNASNQGKVPTPISNSNPPQDGKKIKQPTPIEPNATLAAQIINKPSTSAETKESIFSSASEEITNVLLGTARARIRDSDGNFQSIRLVIDSGSQRSFITSDCAQRLGLPLERNPHRLCGFADSPIPGGKHQVRCVLLPSFKDQPQLETSAVVIPRISDKIPSHSISPEINDQFSKHDLADPSFTESCHVDFLLGSDLFGRIFTGESVDIAKGLPMGLRTIFGLVILGPISRPSTDTDLTLLAANHSSQSEYLDNLLMKFWESEEVNQISHANPLDVECENHFVNTHQRNEQGRYIVRLPFKNASGELGDSHHIAAYRFRKLESRFDKTPDLRSEYSKIIQDYLQLQFISPASSPGKYFLPHHGVFKDSTSTKLRIVFDASTMTTNGSLNDKLLIGPKLQSDIRDVLLNFRTNKFAFTADIQQMFLQVLINPEDQCYLHFVYRFNSMEAMQEFHFNRLPFGLSCSPFLAIRVLKQLIIDEGKDLPLASKALQDNCYVDDILSGANSIEEARQVQMELVDLLGRGGFELKKWSSHSSSLLPDVANSDSSISLANFEDSSVKVLGMKWDTCNDCLSYSVNLPDFVATKRKIMSVIARIYDPLGYLAPVVFKAKSILQDLWRQKLEWDSPIPSNIMAEWQRIYHQLPALQSIKIPRYLFPDGSRRIMVVGFADASALGYAAVIYLRCENDDGVVTSSLLFAKTRLAPIKMMTIPRLELSAAVLLVKSLKALHNFLAPFKIHSTILLSDSSILLSWLRTEPHKLKTFVANRVTTILDNSFAEQWYHVQSADNIADIASRGIEPSSLVERRDWWSGPDWLIKNPDAWPISNQFNSPKDTEIPEIKQVALLTREPQPTPLPMLLEITNRYSSFSRLVRITAYLKRYINNLKLKPPERKLGSLSLAEFNAATLTLVRANQQFYFEKEYPWDSVKSSSLKSLYPFVDAHGIVRVGGRLHHSTLPYDQKHPVLLPPKAHLTNLIIDHFHHCYLHAGPQLLHSLLRRRYWILSARNTIRFRLHKCSSCERLRSRNFAPLMGNLPASRFQQGRAFLNVGIDFAGPFFIKDAPRRNYKLIKSYVCLFICFSTKAIHLEVVSQLMTEAFLAALDRFIARRGLPSHIFTDNGRNFLGASNHLKEVNAWWQEKENQQRIEKYLTSKEIKWSFIPPFAPHFGGLWEAGVKSFKYHLQRVLTSHPLSLEEFTTLSSRIEALLNSRPLHPMSSNPEDFDVLTPGHFLIGAPLLARPEYDFEDTPTNRLSRWQFLHQCIQHIWKKWRMDYLHNLQQRNKWTSDTSNLEIGTLVLLREPNTPPLEWPTGRIIEVFPGDDKVVRVVKLKTSKGEYLRSVTRLAPLLPPDEQ